MMSVTITAKTAAGAAKATLRALSKFASEWGYEDQLPTYHDQRDGYDAPTISWEGFFEWPIALTSGESMLSHELGTDAGAAEIDISKTSGWWFAEPVNGYQLAFFETEPKEYGEPSGPFATEPEERDVEVWEVKWELWNGELPVVFASDPREFLGMKGVVNLHNAPGWYWQLSGYARPSRHTRTVHAFGPFATEAVALAAAQEGSK